MEEREGEGEAQPDNSSTMPAKHAFRERTITAPFTAITNQRNLTFGRDSLLANLSAVNHYLSMVIKMETSTYMILSFPC